ncbi:PREDICTED: uncharacterized protein LOC106901782 [Calidris pugnax]|uniref:uncharacterized protein LOC106901782 n=1 Tax=Calidris pugnax TaxID=198806 RepID=UPI00071E3FD6|nr:PREDICTED: uncharacterized protein LOC106901782 [Calidris pugnax]
MKAVLRQMGTEEEFGEPIMSTQHILPPRGASEIKVKVYQLQKLLESLEIHMIHDVQKKINQEMIPVILERARQESSLPTELWKQRVTQENFSVARPWIVEKFVQRLMENYQESDTEELHTVEGGGNQSGMALAQGKLDVYRLSIEQRVFEIISEVRREGVDNMINLKKKFASTKNNGDLKEHLFKQEQLQLLRDGNTRLSKLVCKLMALNCWKQITQKAQLSANLREGSSSK